MDCCICLEARDACWDCVECIAAVCRECLQSYVTHHVVFSLKCPTPTCDAQLSPKAVYSCMGDKEGRAVLEKVHNQRLVEADADHLPFTRRCARRTCATRWPDGGAGFSFRWPVGVRPLKTSYSASQKTAKACSTPPRAAGRVSETSTPC